MLKRHAHIYKDSLACQAAFKNFIAGFDYQRSDSGMWYASHNETHNFFAATHSEKLRGINWDTVTIAKNINALEKANIISLCMDADVESTAAPQANLATPSTQSLKILNAFILRVRAAGASLLANSLKKGAAETVPQTQ